MKKYIPNSVTSLNLIFGVLAVFQAAQGEITLAAWFIVIAAVMDFLDGLAARLLHAYSEMGEQLDSLADLVSFGLAPTVLVYQLIHHATNGLTIFGEVKVAYIAVLLTLFSALRLARFNTDSSQKNSFVGLPVPASALFFAGIVLAAAYSAESGGLAGWVGRQAFNGWLLIALVPLFSFLMVMPVRLFSLKMKNASWSNNKIQWLFLFFTVVLVVLLKVAALPLIIVGYVLGGIIVNLVINNDD